MATMTLHETRVQNETYLDMLDSGTMSKQAADDTSNYLRLKLREEGFSRKIIEPVDVGPSDFVEQLWTDKPVMIYQKETDVPMSVSVGYAAGPINFYIRPSKFAVTPHMLITPRVFKHKWELRTYKYDVKQVFADNMVKDLQAYEDVGLLGTVNVALIGANSTMPFSGVAQYKTVSGGFSRNSTVTACHQVLQQTPYNIPVETNLVNNITWSEQFRWERNEAGGDLAERNLVKGWSNQELHGQNWLVTIKRGLVANMTQYLFGPAKFLGKTCLFTPPTMYVETKAVGMYMFYAVEEIGTTIAHPASFGRVDYTT
jgi:hypothetical protein